MAGRGLVFHGGDVEERLVRRDQVGEPRVLDPAVRMGHGHRAAASGPQAVEHDEAGPVGVEAGCRRGPGPGLDHAVGDGPGDRPGQVAGGRVEGTARGRRHPPVLPLQAGFRRQIRRPPVDVAHDEADAAEQLLPVEADLAGEGAVAVEPEIEPALGEAPGGGCVRSHAQPRDSPVETNGGTGEASPAAAMQHGIALTKARRRD